MRLRIWRRQLRRRPAIEGGLPLIVQGRQVGSIGVSGGTSRQDAQIARAAAHALGRP